MSNQHSEPANGIHLPPEAGNTLGLVDTAGEHTPPRWRKWLTRTAIAALYLVFLPFLLVTAPAVSELFVPRGLPSHKMVADAHPKRVSQLTSAITALEKKIERFTPGNAFLVVNTTENKFSLYRNRKLVREGLCSTGSYISLEGEGDKKWIFKTPRGEFKVRGKITDPVWRKPDWAFVEEGLPIPPANAPSRYERGVLGEYALALGDGYLIHGTLYQRFLGLPVTHGCIRMNDADLKEVYETLPVGAKVFIY